MKHTTTFIGALLASVALAGAASAQSCEITLRSSDTHPDGYPTVEAVKHMGELLQERSDGRICVEVFHSAQLGEEKDTIEQTQLGVIDMNRVSLGPFNNIIEETKVFSLPYIFRSTDHMHKVVDGEIGTELLNKLEAGGLIGLGYMDAGSRSLYNKVRPITKLEDVQGLKIRVMQNPIFVEMVNAMGGNALPIAFNELYTALQTGIVDGAENNPPSFYRSRHYETCKYYALNEHTTVPDILLISLRTWEALTPEQREWLQRAVDDSVAYQRELWQVATQEALDAVRAAGVEVTHPDKQPFIDAVAEMKAAWNGTPVGALLRAIEAVE